MPLTKPIKGIIGACLTPFDDNDRVNYKALEKEIDFLVTDCDAVTKTPAITSGANRFRIEMRNMPSLHG